MKISRITVNNFRSIEHAAIEPSAFNVLVGQNNHGKTNFFEAIEWFYNASGDLGQITFMRDTQRDVSVEIELQKSVAMDKGLKFAIREGGRTIGSGIVTEVVA